MIPDLQIDVPVYRIWIHSNSLNQFFTYGAKIAEAMFTLFPGNHLALQSLHMPGVKYMVTAELSLFIFFVLSHKQSMLFKQLSIISNRAPLNIN